MLEPVRIITEAVTTHWFWYNFDISLRKFSNNVVWCTNHVTFIADYDAINKEKESIKYTWRQEYKKKIYLLKELLFFP